MNQERQWRSRPAQGIAILVLLMGMITSSLLLSLVLAEQHCSATGGKWHGVSCTPPQTECRCGLHRVPVGTVFWDGCNTCDCQVHGLRCTSKACFDSKGVLIGCF